ncbi:MAG: hypothetical protein AAF694_17900 [Bacteroidota bacterium]
MKIAISSIEWGDIWSPVLVALITGFFTFSFDRRLSSFSSTLKKVETQFSLLQNKRIEVIGKLYHLLQEIIFLGESGQWSQESMEELKVKFKKFNRFARLNLIYFNEETELLLMRVRDDLMHRIENLSYDEETIKSLTVNEKKEAYKKKIDALDYFLSPDEDPQKLIATLKKDIRDLLGVEKDA